ncbi:unnamed protein product [Closterium sp. Naga37s-1]|nr:unnamed protein product [Closterium sp. Naga37s-1]
MRTLLSHRVISLYLVLFLLLPSRVCRADETPGKVFSKGTYPVAAKWLPQRRRVLFRNNPPKPLRIWSPKPASATALPVLLFQHGFSAQTIYYSRLLSRVASHGFIVVAPQMYPITTTTNAIPEILWLRSHLSSTLTPSPLFFSLSPSPFLLSHSKMYPITTTTNAIPEIRASARVISWLRSHLSSTLSNRFKLLASPDWSKFAIAGHSRGGAVCFALLRQLIVPSPVPLKAVVLLDPSNPRKPLRIWSPNFPQRPPSPPPFHPVLPQSNPRKPLRIWSPKPATATALPVLLFQHGFSASLFPSNPPRPLRIWSPKPATATALPVLLFQHGFSAQTSFSASLPSSNPPRPLRIWSPKPASATALPVLLFQHGFSAQTSFYSQLLTRIAKHGYIVVAPQVCG